VRSLPDLDSVSPILPILIGSNEVEMKPSAASDLRQDRPLEWGSSEAYRLLVAK